MISAAGKRLRLVRAPVARIVARLRRHRSTIYHELKRNSFVDEELRELDGCWGMVAHEMATGRPGRPCSRISGPAWRSATDGRAGTRW